MAIGPHLCDMKKRLPVDRYTNREQSWLAFNHRVLQEAQSDETPLIERVHFLGIFSNNLDEFFRVRVAYLQRMAAVDPNAKTTLRFSVAETLYAIHSRITQLQVEFDDTFRQVQEALAEEGIQVVELASLSSQDLDFVGDYFRDEVRPALVPIMLRRGNDMPELEDGAVYLAIRLRMSESKRKLALIQLPDHLPRFLILPEREGTQRVMFLDDVIRAELPRIFRLFESESIEAFAVKATRDAAIDMDDDLSRSVVAKMERGLKRRSSGEVVRFLFDGQMPRDMLQSLLRRMELQPGTSVIPGERYHNRRDLMAFPDFGRKDLTHPEQPSFTHPRLQSATSVMNAMEEGDVLLHFPYHQFVHVVDFLREAAIDPTVRSIKVNLYRVANNSQIINALINAAHNGKQVEVLVELAARFDEKQNIRISNSLKEAGVVVRFGIPKLKVHSKLILVTRKHQGKLRRYAHLGTGNFHEGNAKLYEDLSLLTAHPDITKEVAKIFEFFESSFERKTYKHLFVSPFTNRRRFTALIMEETDRAKTGKAARIRVKLNNLVDAGMIDKLYRASQAGVKVQLMVRGICALKAGVPDLSENIEVRSVVGRYLEHSRFAMFGEGKKVKVFLSSADWMTRNMDRRVEVTAPIYDEALKAQLEAHFDIMWKDNRKSRLVDAEGQNLPAGDLDAPAFVAHQELYVYHSSQRG
ncbi:MAG: polyphosphate kinase 1 [Crocinitomicaceae bacterium]|nr:polyphosphate kinase 1 [Crocinitomicaceae bacterium]